MKTILILSLALIINSTIFAAVELISFTAIGGDEAIQLDWRTASETDNDHFEIERNSQLIASTPCAGNSQDTIHYQWIDLTAINGVVYSYLLVAVDNNGSRENFGPIEAHAGELSVGESLNLPHSFSLSAYPNPFNPVTTISFSLAKSEKVKLTIFNITGQQVSVLANEFLSAGEHKFSFSGSDFPSGVYLARLQTSEFVSIQKLLLLK